MKKVCKKSLSLFLALILLLSLFPATVFAESGNTSDAGGATLSATVYEKQAAIGEGTGLLVAEDASGNKYAFNWDTSGNYKAGAKATDLGNDKIAVSGATEWTLEAVNANFKLKDESKSNNKYLINTYTVGHSFTNASEDENGWIVGETNTLSHTYKGKFSTYTGFILLGTGSNANKFAVGSSSKNNAKFTFYKLPDTPVSASAIVKNKTATYTDDTTAVLPDVNDSGVSGNFSVKYSVDGKNWYDKANATKANGFPVGNPVGAVEKTVTVGLFYGDTLVDSATATVTIPDPRPILEINMKSGPVTVKWYSGRDTELTLKDIFKAVYDSSDPTISLDTDGVQLKYNNTGWREITNDSFSYMKNQKAVRIDFAGNEQYKPSTSDSVYVKLDDTRTATKIVKKDDNFPANLMLGADYAEELNDYFKVVYGGDNTPVPGAKVTFGTKFDNVTGKRTITNITAQYAGNDDYAPSTSTRFSINIVDAPHYTVSTNVTPNNSGTVNVKKVIGFDEEDAPLGFTVTTTPNRGYFTKSIVVKNGENVIATADAAAIENNTFNVAPTKENVKSGDTLTVYVTFEAASVTIPEKAEAKYVDYKLIAKNNEKLQQFIVDAVKPEGTPEAVTEGTPTVEYLVGKVTRTGRVTGTPEVIEYWLEPGNVISAAAQLVEYGTASTGAALLLYDIDEENTWWDTDFCPEIGSTETVRVSYTYNKGTVTSNPCELLIDGRIPTTMTFNYTDFEKLLSNIELIGEVIPVQYGKDLKTQLFNRISIVTDEGTPVDFTADDITVEPESLNVSLNKQPVKVTFKGNDEYATCNKTAQVYVLQAGASLNVSNKVVSYTGTPYNVQDLKLIKANPETLDYFTLIAGIDGDAKGFLSFDFPKSTKDAMRIQLTYKNNDDSESRIKFIERIKDVFDNLENDAIDKRMNGIMESAAKLNIVIEQGDAEPKDWYLDIYKTLSNMSDLNTLSPESLDKFITDLNTMLEESPLIKAAVENSGFDISSLTTALNVLKGLNNITPKTKIVLGKGPTNAGAYTVAAVSTDLNYRIRSDLGELIILPKTDDVTLVWKQTLPRNLTLSYNAAQEFDFGVVPNGIDEKNIHVFYSDFALTKFDLINNEKPNRNPGVHFETVYVLGGNTWTSPMSRMYIITLDGVNIVAENKTVTYDGTPKNIQAEAGAVTNKLTYYYTGDITRGTYYSSSKAPTDAGTYYVTISFQGDGIRKSASKTVKLTIAPLAVALSWTPNPTNYVYDGTEKSVSAQVTNKALSTDRFNLTYEDNKQTNAGNFVAKVTALGNSNYTLNGVDATYDWSIGVKTANVKTNDKTIENGEKVTAAMLESMRALTGIVANDDVRVSYTYTFKINGVTKSFTSAAEAADAINRNNLNTKAGDLIINIKITPNSATGADKGNYAFAVDGVDAKLTVNPAPAYNPTVYKVTCGDGVTANKKAATANSTVILTVTDGDTAPIVKDKNGNRIEVTANGDGTYSFRMPASDITVNMVCPRDETCPIDEYKDTLNDYWWHDGIHYCLDNDLMVGFPNGTFQPNGTLTRAQVVVILWRMEGEPVVNYEMTFKDVQADRWYTEAIRWAQSSKIVEGYNADSFGPNNDVTREQLAAILYRYAQSKGEGFTGSWMFMLDYVDRTDISSWADEAVHWCSMKSIVNGKAGKVFDPKGKATRAEAAAMMQRFCENIL